MEWYTRPAVLLVAEPLPQLSAREFWLSALHWPTLTKYLKRKCQEIFDSNSYAIARE